MAIKVLKLEGGAGSEAQRRFLHEAQAASALNHPHIGVMHEIVSVDGLDFIVMEFVAGRPLSEMIGRRGLPYREAVCYAVQIADALTAAHSAGIVHGDLKPSNVTVTSEGRRLQSGAAVHRMDGFHGGARLWPRPGLWPVWRWDGSCG